MEGRLEEISVIGTISRVHNRYVVITEDGKKYTLSAIMPWTAVSADFGTGKFTKFLGKKARVDGLTDGSTIYSAEVSSAD